MEQTNSLDMENMWRPGHGRLENGSIIFCTDCGVGFDWTTVITVLIGIFLSIISVVGNLLVRKGITWHVMVG